jgi:hypothetical protein
MMFHLDTSHFALCEDTSQKIFHDFYPLYMTLESEDTIATYWYIPPTIRHRNRTRLCAKVRERLKRHLLPVGK